ncbi:hydroxypyruvate isomerase family protein [Chloroflexota bacterium]
MNFSANLSMLFEEYPFGERFKAAANANINEVEFWFPFHHGGERLVDLAEEAGVKVVMFNIDPGDIEAGEWGTMGVSGREEHFMQSLEDALNLAEKFDCHIIHLLAGRIPEGSIVNECWDTVYSNMDWALKQIPENMTYVMEALNPIDMPGYLLEHPRVVRKFLTELDNPSVRQLYDLYHAYCVEDDIMHVLRTEMDLVAHFQIADFPGRHQPGTGRIRFNEIFESIQDNGFQGYIGLEYRPLGTSEESLSWLEKY